MLRQEAQAFSLEELDVEQLGAALRVLEMLDEAAAAIPDERAAEAPRSPRLAMRLDRARRSMVAFLDGARGMGKTSILLTLMRAFDEGVDLAEEEKDPERRRLLGEVGEKIKHLRDRVIWLETLDLEPVASNTNLLAAILARIERRAEELLGHRARGAFSDEETDALGALRDLMREVGFAWEGNVRERASSLDPELYAEEVIAAELARLNFNERLEKALARLSRQIEDAVPGMVRKPLFVLPVDDLDLNPTFTLDLLRLVRAVYCPRLFTVMLGDMEMTDRVVMARYLGELAGRFDYRADVWPSGPEDLGIAARETASQALRKLLPPVQRVELRPPSFEEAMKFRNTKDAKSLEEVLDEIPHFWTSPLTIKGITRKIESFSEYITASGLFKNFWDASRLFETTRRRVVDIYNRLLEVTSEKRREEKERSLLYHVIQIVREAVDEDDRISVKDRKYIIDLLRSIDVMSDANFFEWERLIQFEAYGAVAEFGDSFGEICEDSVTVPNMGIVPLKYYFNYLFHESKYECVIKRNYGSNEQSQPCGNFLNYSMLLLYSILQNKYRGYFANFISKIITSDVSISVGNNIHNLKFSWRIPDFFDIRNQIIFFNIMTREIKRILTRDRSNYKTRDSLLTGILEIWMKTALCVATNGYDEIGKLNNLDNVGTYLTQFISSLAINLAPEFGIPEHVSKLFIKMISNILSHQENKKMKMNLMKIRREIWNDVRSQYISNFFASLNQYPFEENFKRVIQANQTLFQQDFAIMSNYFSGKDHPFNDFLKNEDAPDRTTPKEDE